MRRFWAVAAILVLLAGCVGGVNPQDISKETRSCPFLARPVLYFGHPVAVYGAEIETELMSKIRAAFPGWHVENPNQTHHQEGYQRWKKDTGNGMNYYFKIVLPRVSGGTFLAYRDGKWGAGVYGEALFVFGQGCPIWEVKPDGTVVRTDPEKMRLYGGVLNIAETGARNKVPY